LIAKWKSGIIVHKAMNYNHYNIVIISKRRPLPLEGRNLYADIWLEEKIIKRYYLYELEGWDDYYERIKDITILPNSKEIKVEFTERGIFGSKTQTGVDLYKIE
jgi:hypothetical protein